MTGVGAVVVLGLLFRSPAAAKEAG